MQNEVTIQHLRDGLRPAKPVHYLPAAPLGDGDIDWYTALDAAIAAGIEEFILEMEVPEDDQVFAALETSLGYLDQL